MAGISWLNREHLCWWDLGAEMWSTLVTTWVLDEKVTNATRVSSGATGKSDSILRTNLSSLRKLLAPTLEDSSTRKTRSRQELFSRSSRTFLLNAWPRRSTLLSALSDRLPADEEEDTGDICLDRRDCGLGWDCWAAGQAVVHTSRMHRTKRQVVHDGVKEYLCRNIVTVSTTPALKDFVGKKKKRKCGSSSQEEFSEDKCVLCLRQHPGWHTATVQCSVPQ